MLQLDEKRARQWRMKGEKVSQKLTDLTHAAHFQKVIIADGKERPIFKFPLLLGIVLLIIFPILVGLVLTIALVTGFHIFTEKDH